MNRIAALAASLLLVAGCSSTPDPPPNDPDWQSADSAYLAGDFDVAASHYRRFLDAHPGDDRAPLANLRIGRACLASGQNAQALHHLDLAISRGSDAIAGEAHAARGIAYHNLGSPARAETEFADALRIGGGEVRRDEVLYYLSISKIRQGRWEEGLASLLLIVKDFSDSPYAGKAKALRSLPERYFAIQVGAFSDPAGARKRSEELRAKGYEPAIVPADNLHCVRVGRYATWREANAEAEAMAGVTGMETAVVP